MSSSVLVHLQILAYILQDVSIEDEAYETQTRSLSPGDNLGLPLGVCVFITAVTIIKLFAWGRGIVEDMCYERRRAQACTFSHT